MASLTVAAALPSCRDQRDSQPPSPPAAASAPPAPALSSIPAPTTPPAPAAASIRPVVLLAGGDVDLSRKTGQRILRNPALDPLAALRPWFDSADIRVANLESQVCDLGGVTVSPSNPLVFAAPPGAAIVLSRSRFDALSTANNHAWDFGKRCLSETVSRLHEVNIQTVGTDPDGQDPLRPVVFERRGRKVALFAVTAIFNDGPLPKHAAAPFIAYADIGALAKRIRTIRDRVDWIVASIHIGEEYMHEPVDANRAVLAAAVDAGADVVLAHHSHTPQRVEFYKGAPIAFSLGNLVFHENSSNPWTAWGALARVSLSKGSPPSLELCPYHLVDAAARPLDPKLEAAFFAHWDAISRAPRAAKRGPRASDGCVAMLPP